MRRLTALFAALHCLACAGPDPERKADPVEPDELSSTNGGSVRVGLVRVPGSPHRLFSADISVAGERVGRFRDGDTRIVTGLPRASVSVEARDVTTGCRIAGDASLDVRLVADASAEVVFEVACEFVAESRIAFQRDSAGLNDIWTIHPDGSNAARLTADGLSTRPDWSPDGTRIAFRGAAGLLTVMNHDGTERRQLTHYAVSDPAWSPDGARIAIAVAAAGSASTIRVVEADGSDPIDLTDGEATEGTPAWSPDGTRIVFHRDGELHVMNADGSGVAALTAGRAPTWSPDGSAIAFVSRGPTGTEADQIWLVRSDGGGLTRLTDFQAGCAAPAYRPDGLVIIVHCPPTAGFLWIMNADGSNMHRLQPHPGPGGFASWFEPGTGSGPRGALTRHPRDPTDSVR